MKESTLRDAPFAFMDLLHATTNRGMTFQIGSTEVRYACGVCDGVTFDQTSEGWRALREHELEHGRAMIVDLSELDGKTLRIVTWAVIEHGGSWCERRTPEIWGVDDEHGVVYHLSNAYQGETVWKWRIKSGSSGALAALNAATPVGQD